MFRRTLWYVAHLGNNYEESNDRIRAPAYQANLVSSLCQDLVTHMPAIDIDHPCSLRETSPGKFHLFIDVPMTWNKYEALLFAMVQAGIVEEGFHKASRQRGQTMLRREGFNK